VIGQETVKSNPSGEQADTTYYEEWVNPTDAKKMLKALGIIDIEQPINTLSGGQKKRVALARTLLHPTDVLLLDEPTNHLDSQMIEWLEEYLQTYKGCILLVTHDRYFLDNVTNRIIEIDQGHIYGYDSNYEGYLKLKCEREEMELATDDKRRNLLRNELKWVMRGAQARSTKQKARLQRFEELKNTKGPRQKEALEMESVASRLGKKTIEIHHIAKSYGNHTIIQDFDYTFLRNERVGIVGTNGCGKSTLLKLLVGELQPDSGYIEYGETIRIGYLGQEPESISPDIRVIDSVKDIAEYLPTASGRISASKMCERFLFTPDMQYTLVGKLSGGERRRLYLLHVLMQAPNVLILDEPTNDLDIETLNVLEDYLDYFEGIIIVVSHDRYFLDRIVGRIFAFESDGLQQYEGGYTEYYWKHQERYGAFLSLEEEQAKRTEAASVQKPSDSELEKKEAVRDAWKQHSSKLKFTYKEQREYETIDDDIAKLEEQIEQLETEIQISATDFVALAKYTAQKEELEQALDEKMERWVYLNDLAEQIEADKK
jgi:ATP-binding cassette subfamily F protein uup